MYKGCEFHDQFDISCTVCRAYYPEPSRRTFMFMFGSALLIPAPTPTRIVTNPEITRILAQGFSRNWDSGSADYAVTTVSHYVGGQLVQTCFYGVNAGSAFQPDRIVRFESIRRVIGPSTFRRVVLFED